jgi:hypothetical protein
MSGIYSILFERKVQGMPWTERQSTTDFLLRIMNIRTAMNPKLPSYEYQAHKT